MSGGSDVHRTIQENMGGTSFPYKINTIEEYIKAFMAGDGTPVFRKNVHDSSTEFRAVESDASLLNPDRNPYLPIVVCKD